MKTLRLAITNSKSFLRVVYFTVRVTAQVSFMSMSVLTQMEL